MTPAARERRRVDAPIFAITTAAWIALALKAGGSGLSGSCCIPTSVAAGFLPKSMHMLLMRNPVPTLVSGWTLMLVAMMAALLSAPIRHVVDRSFARRRWRSVLLFLTGYTAIWLAAGLVILSVALTAKLFLPTSPAPAIASALVAFVWQCSPLKQRSLNRGHAHVELAAFGRAADVDSIRFGLTHGIWCVASCWALMLLPELISTWHLPAMAAVTIYLLAERLDRPAVPRWRLRTTGKAVRLVIAQTRQLLQPS